MKTIKLLLTGIKLRFIGFFFKRIKPVPTLEIKGMSELIKQTKELIYCLEKANQTMINFKTASSNLGIPEEPGVQKKTFQEKIDELKAKDERERSKTQEEINMEVEDALGSVDIKNFEEKARQNAAKLFNKHAGTYMATYTKSQSDEENINWLDKKVEYAVSYLDLRCDKWTSNERAALYKLIAFWGEHKQPLI